MTSALHPFALIQDLFTDGLSFQHHDPELCLAAWAIVHAGTESVLATSQLAGMIQTAARVEITAVIGAATWALQQQAKVVVWCDAKHVVDGTTVLQSRGYVASNQASDLWFRLQRLLGRLPSDCFQVQHVPSHLDPGKCDNPFEEWLAKHNAHADRVAVTMINNRGQKFADLHQQAVDRFTQQSGVVRSLRKVFFAIAEGQEETRQAAAEDEVLPPPCPTPLQDLSISDGAPINWSRGYI